VVNYSLGLFLPAKLVLLSKRKNSIRNVLDNNFEFFGVSHMLFQYVKKCFLIAIPDVKLIAEAFLKYLQV